MRGFKAASASLALIAGASLMPANAAVAASVCTFESQVVINPAVSPTPHTGTFATPAPGTITCHGSIEGTGTIEYHGKTGTAAGGESCALDAQGLGDINYTINGVARAGTFSFTRLGAGGQFNGTLTGGGDINGTFEFIPKDGQDCVNVPISQATVKGQAVISGY
ncbi:MAG: hypothetical protein NVSMB57_06670 [Actinomycetota bacterium]